MEILTGVINYIIFIISKTKKKKDHAAFVCYFIMESKLYYMFDACYSYELSLYLWYH